MAGRDSSTSTTRVFYKNKPEIEISRPTSEANPTKC